MSTVRSMVGLQRSILQSLSVAGLPTGASLPQAGRSPIAGGSEALNDGPSTLHGRSGIMPANRSGSMNSSQENKDTEHTVRVR